MELHTMSELNSIRSRLYNACKALPPLPNHLPPVPSDPFLHESSCQDLPDGMQLRDRWLHGMRHEVVSSVFCYLDLCFTNCVRGQACLYRAIGRAVLHGIPANCSSDTLRDLAQVVCSNVWPWDPLVAKVTAKYLSGMTLQDQTACDIEWEGHYFEQYGEDWWNHLETASFPPLTVSTLPYNCCECAHVKV